jgi:hypothetical protein
MLESYSRLQVINPIEQNAERAAALSNIILSAMPPLKSKSWQSCRLRGLLQHWGYATAARLIKRYSLCVEERRKNGINYIVKWCKASVIN